MRTIKLLAFSIFLCTAAASAFAEDQWWPSKYGADDELGAFNLLTPELALKAASLVKTGKTYRLGIETNKSTPAFPPRTFSVQVVVPNQYDGTSIGKNKFNYADDIISGWMGVGSQIDGLGHAGTDGIYYNGKRAKDFVRVDGLTKFGMENLPAVVTRGVMLDIAKCMGKDMLTEGTAFNRKEIMACEKAQGVSIQKGDVVLFNTGWLKMLDSDPVRFGKGEPGLGIDGARYLVEKDVVAVGGDGWGLEVIPTEDPDILYHVHQILINYNGIYILENMDTRGLAADNAYEFMFVLGAARMTGAVQMIINPIAIR